MKLFKDMLTSKKFFAMVVGVATIIVSEGVTSSSMNQVAAIVISYIFAQGIADVGKSAETLRQKVGD